MKKRIFFNKCEEMRFISHLDLLRFFERVMIKANIPVKYSQGFHPRPKISFGNPIPLGTESFNEVLELELEKEMSNLELLNNFNSLDIKGFKVLSVEEKSDKVGIAERFSVAIYEIESNEESIDKLFDLFSQNNIIETKEKKGKVVERDLKEKIRDFKKENEKKIVVNIFNGSPNTFLEICKIKDFEVNVKKIGYEL